VTSDERASVSAPGDDPAYSYKPSLLGAAWQFRLRPDALEWQAGRYQGRMPYGRIARVRLSFRPVTMQTRRFVTEIWPPGGAKLSIQSTSWRSLVEQETQDRAYGAFVRELHRRLATAGAEISFETGVPPVVYWPGLAVFAVLTLGLAALALRALQIGQLSGAALVGGLLVLLLWQSGGYFRRNRPGRYRPDALPGELMPDG